jgi:transposase
MVWESMTTPTLLPCIEGIQIDSIAAPGNAIVLRLSTVAACVNCPHCGHPTDRVHSRYPRTLMDMPWNHVSVRIHLRSRKLFCHNPACSCRIFTEPLPEMAARYARKTLRLQEAFYLIGYIIGGRAGQRVALGLGIQTSPDTLLRRVRQVATQNYMPPPTLRIVGVDDWAFKKGHRYGTILIDLERRLLVDLLPDRSSESLATWLTQHPEIEVLSRDRASVYAEAAREGAPQAKQVADRWHLLRNLGEAMERLTAQHATHLRQAAKQNQAAKPEAPVPPETSPARLPHAEQRRLERCAAREALYNKVKALRQQHLTAQAIAKETGISQRTVQRFLRAEQFPARARRRQSRQADRYASYLRQRLEAGCQNAAQLYREIQSQGYDASYSSVTALVRRLKSEAPTIQKARSPANSGGETPPSRSVAWWLQGHRSSKPEVSKEQTAFLKRLYLLAPVLQEAGQLAQEFVRLVKKRQASELDAWFEKVSQSTCKELRLFAQGLCQDLSAVRNAMTLEWSNGQTEGQVNRLKMIKRQMYGRANFDLLRARVLPRVQAA